MQRELLLCLLVHLQWRETVLLLVHSCGCLRLCLATIEGLASSRWSKPRACTPFGSDGAQHRRAVCGNEAHRHWGKVKPIVKRSLFCNHINWRSRKGSREIFWISCNGEAQEKRGLLWRSWAGNARCVLGQQVACSLPCVLTASSWNAVLITYVS